MTYDITEISKKLGITSRTLRFYEEKGIIASEKTAFSSRRRYTEAQVEQIRWVLVLRTLGISLKEIKAIQEKEKDLKSAVLSRRAEIMASIHTKKQELLLLNDALARMEAGGTVWQAPPIAVSQIPKLARSLAEAIVFGDTETLYRHIGLKLAEYMPREAYESIRKDTLAPLGAFLGFASFARDRDFPDIAYCYAEYERLGLKIKLVFHDGKLDGLWMSYYEMEKRNGI